jgi:hypothetical protein
MTITGTISWRGSLNGGTFYHWFNPSAFARPGLNDPGKDLDAVVKIVLA